MRLLLTTTLAALGVVALSNPGRAQSVSCHQHSCIVLQDGSLYHLDMNKMEQTGSKVALPDFYPPGALFCDDTQVCLIVDRERQFWRANMRQPTDLDGPKRLK